MNATSGAHGNGCIVYMSTDETNLLCSILGSCSVDEEGGMSLGDWDCDEQPSEDALKHIAPLRDLYKLLKGYRS